MPNAEILATATSLFLKSTILAAKWAGASRRKALESIAAMSVEEKDKEILFLRDHIEQLELQVQILRKNAGKKAKSPRYTIALEPIPHDVKVVPMKIVRWIFAEARVTGFRLRKAA